MKTKKETVEKKIKIETGEKVQAEEQETPFCPDDVSALKNELSAREKESKENYDRYLRAAADLDNYRKRAARERADIVKYGKEDLIRDILPFLDSLDRALEHKDTDDAQAFRDGVALIQEQLLCCLKKHGVERIESVGVNFDPNIHEALMQMESPDHEDNQVVSEMEKGYLLNGRLIRPSRVCVCKNTGKSDGWKNQEANGE
ncbi:MAG: nucleotide exchange factor GrpE [Smithellaceae bacterium]|nr:nucleotide exchange factor GrpE [Smithellaceae bacterium]MDD3259183.1 nucleotide exchange factor GrpE [Smithellaceae bacterium]MDD3849269.1 nucleotide exchange factor GrpE [Smithellaceae bacterium]